MRRLLAAGGLALILASMAAPAAAHPLGNYTVNRAVAVTIGAERIEITYLVDMAEIPAFAEIDLIDADGDGSVSAIESDAYASAACDRIAGQVEVMVNEERSDLRSRQAPELTFPIGAGGLPTLRLSCRLLVAITDRARSLSVADRIDDGHVGWREVSVRPGDGVRLTSSDAPSDSESRYLTSYPMDRLQTPPDVRGARATFERISDAAGSSTISGGAVPVPPTAGDPLAALVAGELSPPIVILALLVAAGLGAAHAASPGHGKTLVAAYLIGSRGTVRQAIALGVTVAATHTAGVLALGTVVLVAGELFLPEVVIGWLTVISGTLMAVLGAMLLVRAAVRRKAAPHNHVHAHPHPHPHAHPHARGAGGQAPALTVRSVALLGVAGGMVPSASALIVLLAAVTTGRLVFGLALIAAFGIGMSVILGGLAVATTVARGWLDGRSWAPRSAALQRLVRAVPIGSGLLVLGIGVGIALGAMGRLG